MSPAGVIVLIIVLLLLAGGIGWIFFARYRAQRLGLPPPSLSSFVPFTGSSRSSYGVQPAPGGITGWINDRIRGFKNRNNRTAAGAYEGAGPTGSRGVARQGFGPLDPDEAWDARVGAEADAYYYNEEQELGLHTGGQHQQNPRNASRLDVSNTAYLGGGALGGSTYDMNVPADGGEELEERGRTRGRTPGTIGAAGGRNPFDDDADPSNMSLRGVSPRPMVDTGLGGAGSSSHHGNDHNNKADSPTERKSMFRENVDD